MKQTENKMKKYLDHIMTAAFVSMLVAILLIVVMPGEKGKAANVTKGLVEIDSYKIFDGSGQDTAGKLSPSTSYKFYFDLRF